MKTILIAIMIFFSTVCFAQTIKIVGKIPPSNSTKLYIIQVGSYKAAANAEKAFNKLRSSGLNPVYENYSEYRRVVLSGISAKNIPHLLNIIRNAGLNEVWIKEEKISSVFTINTIGQGAVTEINDFADREPLAIVQTIPSFNDNDSGNNRKSYQSNAPIVLFFNDKIHLGSIAKNINITVDNKPIDGTININEGVNGYAVLTFTPKYPLPAGKNVSVTVKKGLQDDGGNQMLNELKLSYIAEKGSDENFVNNFGFESGSKGIVFTGDGAICTARGDLKPFEGNHYVAISSGERIVSDNGVAIGSRSSQIQLGPIQQAFSSFVFHYDFISAEFNDYVGSKYDDNAIVTIYGPKGSYSEIITSVNKIGNKNIRFKDYSRMPDDGDSYAGHTGWQRYSMEKINVGVPAYIIFTVTDVSDKILSSILAIDALELK